MTARAEPPRRSPGAPTVTVIVPEPLREAAGGLSELTLDADPATGRAALGELRLAHPALYDRIITERGEVRPHVNLIVGDTEIRHLDGLDTPVVDGSEIVILPSVSGG